MSKLLMEVVIQLSKFQPIDCLFHLIGDGFQSGPYQHGYGYVIALAALFTTLAAFNTGGLLVFAVKLLHLPADAALSFCGFRALLSDIIGHDIIRALSSERYPQQFKAGVCSH